MSEDGSMTSRGGSLSKPPAMDPTVLSCQDEHRLSRREPIQILLIVSVSCLALVPRGTKTV